VDSYNIKSNYASSNLDQRNILNFSYVYTLPTLAASNRLTRNTLGGWQWSGITEIQSGHPFSITDGAFYDNAGVANGEGTGSWVDAAPGINRHSISGPRTQPGILGPILDNPAAYNAPTGLTFGDLGRNSLNSPRTSNFDMGVFKHFPIGEKLNTEFRAEAFNVFNHTQFQGVNSSPSCFAQYGGFAYNAGNNDCVNGNAAEGIEPSNFMHPSVVHDPRLLQFALKLIF
jgi:hypothetical protein